MSHPRSELSELIALTQLHLLQEYSAKEWICSDSETYHYFKALEDARRQNKKENTQENPRLQEEPKQPQKARPAQPPVHIPSEEKPAKEPPKPETAPQVIESKADPVPKRIFVPEPLTASKETDLADMRATVAELLPQVKIAQAVPAPAPKTSPPVVLLVLGETGEELLFVHNVASAIDRLLLPSEVVSLGKKERDTAWQALLNRPGLRWIIAFGDEVYGLPGIAKGQQNVGKISLLLQPASSTILRDPQQKAALWKLLKQLLK